jgi:hypothetical protein
VLVGADAVLGGVGTWAALTALAHLSTAGPAYLRLAPGYEAAKRIGEIHFDLVEYAVLSFVGLILLAPLAFAVRRAWPAARVAAWIVGIVETIGSLIVLAGGPDELVSPDGIESPAVGTALENLLPGWYLGATGVLTAGRTGPDRGVLRDVVSHQRRRLLRKRFAAGSGGPVAPRGAAGRMTLTVH